MWRALASNSVRMKFCCFNFKFFEEKRITLLGALHYRILRLSRLLTDDTFQTPVLRLYSIALSLKSSCCISDADFYVHLVQPDATFNRHQKRKIHGVHFPRTPRNEVYFDLVNSAATTLLEISWSILAEQGPPCSSWQVSTHLALAFSTTFPTPGENTGTN